MDVRLVLYVYRAYWLGLANNRLSWMGSALHGRYGLRFDRFIGSLARKSFNCLRYGSYRSVIYMKSLYYSA